MMKILFVCMGNICRSPAAENVMRAMLAEEGLTDEIQIDSAGTIGYHAGNPPDRRMTAAAKRRGMEMSGRARRYRPDDFESFDLILVMDRENHAVMERARQDFQGATARLAYFCEFCPESGRDEVPDPYYGGEDGFELVLDLMEEGCRELIRQYRAGEFKTA